MSLIALMALIVLINFGSFRTTQTFSCRPSATLRSWAFAPYPKTRAGTNSSDRLILRATTSNKATAADRSATMFSCNRLSLATAPRTEGLCVHSFVHSSALSLTVAHCAKLQKQKMRSTLDFIGRNALFQVVEIRGVEPLTFSMPLRRSTN